MFPIPPAQDIPLWTTPDLWLDADHFLEWVTLPEQIEPCGGLLWHRRLDALGGWCCGAFYWQRPTKDLVIGNHGLIPNHGDLWQLVQRDPLTITPSFLCHCGAHGFITNGRYVAA